MRRTIFDLEWWYLYYTWKIDRVCDRTNGLRQMGLFDEEALQNSNEELYKCIMARNMFSRILDREEAEQNSDL